MRHGPSGSEFAQASVGLPWANTDARCCGRPLDVVDVEAIRPGYWEDEDARRQCILKCGNCGKRYLGW